jgi:TolA-binding protein
MQESLEILDRIEQKQFGYEATSGRYAAFYLGEYFYRIGNLTEAKRYYSKTVTIGEESETQESGYYLYSLISLGKIATFEKNKPLAKTDFNQVKKYAKRKHPAHQEARDFIKKNKL